jgi:hypothetical protein
MDGSYYGPPDLFPNSATGSQGIQPFKQKIDKGKGVGQCTPHTGKLPFIICTDRSFGIGDNSQDRFAQGSYSRASAPSITIDEMDDDDEPLASQALPAFKGVQSDATDSTHMSEDSDDDLYQSVRSDYTEGFVGPLPSGLRSSWCGLEFSRSDSDGRGRFLTA